MIEVRVGERREPWALARTADPDVYAVVVPRGERREVQFIAGGRTLSRSVAGGEQADFAIRHAGIDYPTRIVGVPPAAEFDAAWQAAHRGRIEVAVPEVYELVNVALAITPSARASPFLIARDHPYHEAVMAWFLPFAGHRLIAALERELAERHYFDVKMNAYAFGFDAGGRIVRSAVYDRTGFAGSWYNHLAPYLGELQSFADASRFREFFRSQHQVYRQQQDFYREQVGLVTMLDWLRAQFPAVPAYDGYQVVFSPLVGGRQSVTWFESNGYRELQVHVNFPYPRPDDRRFSAAGAVFRRGEIVFTELNHGFINPAAEPFRAQIDRVFAAPAAWIRTGSSAAGYERPIALFLEMMNWALVALYAEDVAPAADRERLGADLDAFLGPDGRGFRRFAPFRAELLRLYRQRAPGTTVQALYPLIIAWCEAQTAAAPR